MATRLLIEGNALELFVGQTLSIKKKSGLLNFEVIEPTISFPFDLPYTPANIRAFGHIDQLASTRKFAKEYEAQLEVDGLLLYVGKFVLEKVIPKTQFSGYFKADAGSISTQGETSILDFLEEQVSLNHYSDAYSNHYASLESDFVFPKINYRTERSIFHNFPYAIAANSFNRLCLCVKISYVLKKLVEGLGFAPVLLIDDYLFNQAIFIGSKVLTSTPAGAFSLAVRDYVPDMSVSAFLRSIRATFGIALAFDSRTGKCKIGYLKDILTTTAASDWTAKAAPHPELERMGDGSGGTFAFDSFEKLEEEKIAPVDKKLALPSAIENEGKLCLVRWENQYYKAMVQTTSLESNVYVWEPFAPALDPLTFTDIDFEVKTDFAPLPNSFSFVYTYSKAKIIDNGSGKVRITGLGRDFPEEVVIRITSVRALGDTWQATANRSSNYIDLPFLDFIEEESGVEFEWLVSNNNELLPDARLDLQDKPMISLWHGNAYANASGIAADGSAQLSPALRWEDGLVSAQFTEFLELLQFGKQITHKARLKLIDLINFDPFEKIMIDGNVFVIGELEGKMGNKLMTCQITSYKA